MKSHICIVFVLLVSMVMMSRGQSVRCRVKCMEDYNKCAAACKTSPVHMPSECADSTGQIIPCGDNLTACYQTRCKMP